MSCVRYVYEGYPHSFEHRAEGYAKYKTIDGKDGTHVQLPASN